MLLYAHCSERFRLMKKKGKYSNSKYNIIMNETLFSMKYNSFFRKSSFININKFDVYFVII